MDWIDTVSWFGSSQSIPQPEQTLMNRLLASNRSVCVLFVGACTGPIFDRGHLRLLLLIGSFGVVFGFMMLSLCTEFWQALLAQGFVIGLGGGMLFVPSVAILPTYFSTKIGLAIGLAASGSSMGGTKYKTTHSIPFHLHPTH
jgi:MFS family permease